MSISLIEEIKKQYYTLREAAEILQHDEFTLSRWIKSGKIKAEPLGRNVFIHKSEVERLKGSDKL